MQYTTHYNLNLPEGTDVVNPLVQDNPKYTAIDAAMFDNKQAVIGTASEVVSGTVHAVTRSNTDSDYFRFTATGNWTTGDTMTVDGVTVSVFLSDGTVPLTGDYVINSEVLALLSGTRVTLIISGAQTTTLPASAISYNGGDVSDTLDILTGQESITVTSDGIATYADILAALYSLIDNNKISNRSYLKVASIVCFLSFHSSNRWEYSRVEARNNVTVDTYDIRPTAATCKAYRAVDNVITDLSATAPVAGNAFTIVY